MENFVLFVFFSRKLNSPLPNSSMAADAKIYIKIQLTSIHVENCWNFKFFSSLPGFRTTHVIIDWLLTHDWIKIYFGWSMWFLKIKFSNHSLNTCVHFTNVTASTMIVHINICVLLWSKQKYFCVYTNNSLWLYWYQLFGIKPEYFDDNTDRIQHMVFGFKYFLFLLNN